MVDFVEEWAGLIRGSATSRLDSERVALEAEIDSLRTQLDALRASPHRERRRLLEATVAALEEEAGRLERAIDEAEQAAAASRRAAAEQNLRELQALVAGQQRQIDNRVLESVSELTGQALAGKSTAEFRTFLRGQADYFARYRSEALRRIREARDRSCGEEALLVELEETRRRQSELEDDRGALVGALRGRHQVPADVLQGLAALPIAAAEKLGSDLTQLLRDTELERSWSLEADVLAPLGAGRTP